MIISQAPPPPTSEIRAAHLPEKKLSAPPPPPHPGQENDSEIVETRNKDIIIEHWMPGAEPTRHVTTEKIGSYCPHLLI